VPKTIDNDLACTDHCPGYGSAAQYIATSCMEIYQDARVYDVGMATVLEVMGRNAGWLVAAASLATRLGMGPDLIYLPEIPFSFDDFLGDVEGVYSRSSKVIVAVSEGARTKEGKYVAECAGEGLPKDSFGHSQLGGVAGYLAAMVKDRLNIKVRGIEFSLLQRCAAHLGSRTDVEESFAAGRAAVRAAVEGSTDVMVGFKVREDLSLPYEFETVLVPLDRVANAERKVPGSMMNGKGNGLNEEFARYALPLIEGESGPPFESGLPRFARLRKVRA